MKSHLVMASMILGKSVGLALGAASEGQAPRPVVQVPVSAFCQLSTSDETKSYGLDVTARPDRGYMTFKTTAWDDVNGLVVLAQGSNAELFSPSRRVTIQVSGHQGSKTMTIHGIGQFLDRADKPVITSEIIIELTQITHPDDGTRASGAIFHGLKSMSALGKDLLPDGVTLTGIGNCFQHTGFEAYGF